MNYDHTLSAGTSYTTGWTEVPDGYSVALGWTAGQSTLITIQQSQHADGMLPTRILATVTVGTASVNVSPSQPYVRGVYKNMSTSPNYLDLRTTVFTLGSATLPLPTTVPTIADLVQYNSLVADTDHQLVRDSYVYTSVSSRVTYSIGTGASVTFATGTMNLVAAASTLSSVVVRSTMPVISKPGKGSRARFSLAFPNTAAAHEAYSGFIGPNGMFALGLSNSTFGVVLDTVSVNPVYAASVTASAAGAVNLVLDSSTYTDTVPSGYTTALAGAFYLGKTTVSNLGRGWRAWQLGSDVVFMSDIAYVPSGAFTVSSSVLTASISVFSAGMSRSSLSFVPQSSFNIDPLDGSGPSAISISLANLNVFELAFVNSGNAYAAVQAPSTGRFVPFHVVKNATFPVPSMNLGYTMINRGNAVTPLTMSSTFMSGFVPQSTMVPTRLGSYDRHWIRGAGGDTTITSTLSALVSLQLKPFFGTTPAQGFIQIMTAGLSTLGPNIGAMVTLNLLRYGTLSFYSGPASQSSLDPYTLVLVNTVSSTVTGQSVFSQQSYQQSPPSFWTVTSLSLRCMPGETLIFATSAPTTSVTSVSLCTTWHEYF